MPDPNPHSDPNKPTHPIRVQSMVAIDNDVLEVIRNSFALPTEDDGEAIARLVWVVTSDATNARPSAARRK